MRNLAKHGSNKNKSLMKLNIPKNKGGGDTSKNPKA
jgi:hypothetical protein